jgi:protein O-GlcNAc transferase
MSESKGPGDSRQPTRAAPPQAPDLATLFQRAMALHQRGQLPQAESLYRTILEQEPNHADALQYLGVIEYQRKHYEAAVQLIGAALKLDPEDASAHVNMGVALRDLKRPEEALASYDRALAIDTDFPEALCNRGLALLDLRRADEALADFDRALALEPDLAEALNYRGTALRALNRPEEALASFDRALAIRPDFAEALNSRSAALRDLERPAEALPSYDQAVAIKPDSAEALNSRGVALHKLERREEALATYDHALAIRPDFAEALYNRGIVLRELGRPEEALASYDRALTVRPDFADAMNNRGSELRSLGRLEEALASYDRALAVRPDFADAMNNRGNALRDLKRPKEALASYDRALEIKPDHARALNNRAGTLLGLKRFEEAATAFERVLCIDPDLDYARGQLLEARLRCCDWQDYHRNIEPIVGDVQAGKRAIAPFTFLKISESPRDQLRCAQTYSNNKNRAPGGNLWMGENYRHDRIRVAYLSADFHGHATAFLMAELFEAHDKARFETTAISFGPDSEDEMRKRLQNAFGRFVDVQDKNDRDVAHLLKELEIDIAVDLKGYTQDERSGILAFRPAPIQVNYLGYPGTMGADYIDYIIADRNVIPEDHKPFFSEKIVYLPDAYQPNDSKRRIGERTPTRPAAGLPETGFVFCSFNNNYKILPPVFDVWMRLLRRVEGSVLWLLQDNEAAVRNLRREAERRGMPRERLVFAPRVDLDDHLARHRLADLFLDTLPFNAHTTASDALWAGLPVVTCLGTAFAGRVAGSLLHAVGMPELVTNTLEDYEALALKLARDRDRLAAVKAKLARQRETFPLFDIDRYRRHIESAYEGMWERYQRGEPPAGFAVEPSPAP